MIGDQKRQPHRVLFVEDYPPFKRAFSRLLTRGFGLEVTIAETGEDAIGEFGDVNPELIILDLGLPGVAGTETLQVIRALPGGDKVPVIILTGSNDPKMVSAAAELDVKGYVLKENATDEFADLILAVFPDLRGDLGEQLQSLSASPSFDEARLALEGNTLLVSRVPQNRRGVRVLLPSGTGGSGKGAGPNGSDGLFGQARSVLSRMFGGANGR